MLHIQCHRPAEHSRGKFQLFFFTYMSTKTPKQPSVTLIDRGESKTIFLKQEEDPVIIYRTPSHRWHWYFQDLTCNLLIIGKNAFLPFGSLSKKYIFLLHFNCFHSAVVHWNCNEISLSSQSCIRVIDKYVWRALKAMSWQQASQLDMHPMVIFWPDGIYTLSALPDHTNNNNFCIWSALVWGWLYFVSCTWSEQKDI